jgi:hypothetical protein
MTSAKNDKNESTANDSEATLSYSPDDAPTVESLIAFIQSATYEEKRQLVAKHPELLTSKADEFMARFVDVQRKHGTEQDANGLQTWREFLADVRRENFDYALAISRINHIFVEMPEDPLEWRAYLKRVAESEKPLRTKEGDQALAEFAMKMEDGLPDVAAAFQGLRSLVSQLARH